MTSCAGRLYSLGQENHYLTAGVANTSLAIDRYHGYIAHHKNIILEIILFIFLIYPRNVPVV